MFELTVATVSLAKLPVTIGTPTLALMAYFARQDDLHAALRRTDVNAARDIALGSIRMEIAASDYGRLTGRKLSVRAAIDAALASQDINTAHWRMVCGKVVSLAAALDGQSHRAA